MKALSAILSIIEDTSRLLLPHLCMGCGDDTPERSSLLCANCMIKLPVTNHFQQPHNEVYEKFAGRMQIKQAASMFYFTKRSLMQHLFVQLKYKGHEKTGLIFGNMLGQALQETPQFQDVSLIVPLPLNEYKMHIRGYNQAALIARGITDVWPKEYDDTAINRSIFTQTQTQKNRFSRFENMEGVFAVKNPGSLSGKHVLLVDDIVTTGATLEACGREMLSIPGVQLSFVTVACSV